MGMVYVGSPEDVRVLLNNEENNTLDKLKLKEFEKRIRREIVLECRKIIEIHFENSCDRCANLGVTSNMLAEKIIKIISDD